MNTPIITTVAAQTTTAASSPTSVLVTRQTGEKSSVEIPVVSCPTARSVVTSSSAKVMPVFYIQSSSSGTVRVAPANGTTAASTAGTSTIQKLPTAPRIVAGAHPVKQPTQHLVIQQAGGKQYAYVGTIIKPHGNKELLLSAGVLPKLAPAPPAPPAVNVAASQPPTTVQATGSGTNASNKMTSLLVTLPPGTHTVPSKPGMINLKISNGQIHTDNKGCITVLRDSSKVLSTTPTLQPATVKPNGLLIPEATANTLTLTPVSSEAQGLPVVSQQPIILPAPPVLQPQQPRPEPLAQQRPRVQQQQQQPQQLLQQQQPHQLLQQQQQQQQQQKPQQLQFLQHHPQKQQQQSVHLQPEQQQQLLQQQQKVKQEQQKLKQEQQQQKLKQEQLQKLKQEQQQQLQKLKQEQQQKHQIVPSACAIAVVPTTGTATVITVPTIVTSSHGTSSVIPKIKEDSAHTSTVVSTIGTTSATSVTPVSTSSLTTAPAALKAKDDGTCTTVNAAAVAGTTTVITVPISVSPSPPSASGAPKVMEDNARTSVLATSTMTASLITSPTVVTTSHTAVSVAPKMKEDSVRTTSVVTTAGTTIISIPATVSPSSTTICAVAKPKEESTRNTQDLNRCLQEAVDSFSPPHVQNDEVTLIKVVKPDEPDASPRPAQLPPEDDVKIELVKQDVTVRPSQPPTQTTDIDSDDFDPMKVLEWKNGVGTLPGSDLKFRMNEFGIMEMIDEDDCEKLKQDTKPVSEAQRHESTEQTSSLSECSSLLKAMDKREEKHSSKTPSSQQMVRPPKKENPSGSNLGQGTDGGSSSSGTDEIYCCEGCGCYGLSTEFVSSRFCSDVCASNFASRRAQQSKRERDLLLLRLRRRKKRLLQLMQQQQSQNYARHRLRPMPRDRQLLQHLQTHYARAVQSGMVSSTAKENCEIEISTQPVSKSDETTDDVSDDKTVISWLSSKKGFLWPKYLEHCKGKQAPQKLFRDPFPYMKNGFKVGMKLEGIDPEHPSYFCVLTVSDVQGYRIRLHFDGYPDNHDFWVNADSVDIFPAGWCEKNNHKLQPPKGYSPSSFNWNAYLKQCHAQAAPRNLFANKPGNAVCPSGFRIGMKLEAVDRQNKNSVCVATVADIVDNRILVHFDGWDEAFDYWADPSSPYIHPVGWCEEHNRQLTPPKTYRSSQQFSWPQYLRETKSVPAPARAFKQRPPSGFRPGMHLECVDKRVPQLIRVATVSAVRGHQLRIEFDGWPREYGYWVDDDSPDLHPVGWCQKTGHPLEPPLVPEETGSNSECPILGCNGVGHIKGPKFAMHTSAEFCPYAPGNFQCMNHIPERLLDKVASTEIQQEICSSEKPKVQEQPHKNPVGRPPKRRRIENFEEPKPLIVVQEEEEPAPKRERHFLEESTNLPAAVSDARGQDGEDLRNGSTASERSASPNLLVFANTLHKDSADIKQLELEIRNSVRSPGYDPQPFQGPIPWTQHTQYLNTFITAVPRPPELVSCWTCDDVSTFLRSIPGCSHAVNAFAQQEVDGDALVLMSQEDLMKTGGLKLGPAVKLYNCVVLLRHMKGLAEGQTMS